MTTKEIGDMGEAAACRYLEQHGYEILERNYRKSYGEIDIIAVLNRRVSFVEVKTRNVNAIATPAAWVDKKKQKKIIHCAWDYMKEHKEDRKGFSISLDVVEVVYDKTTGSIVKIRHLKNAFWQEQEDGYAPF